MGTVRHRVYGRKKVYFIDWIDGRGVRRREVIGEGPQARQFALRILAQKEAEAVLGRHGVRPAETPRFSDFAEDWLHRIRARGLAPKTVEAYQDFVEHHFVPAFGEMRLGALTRADVENYLVHKLETPRMVRHRSPVRRPADETKKKTPSPLSPRTVGHHLTVLKTILTDAVDHGHLAANPAVKVKAPARRDREDGLQFLQPDEIARLLDVAEESWRMLYLLAIHTGLRRGELLGLRWRDLDLRKRLLSVRRSLSRVPDEKGGYKVTDSPLKTRYSRRTLDLSPAIVEALLTFPAGDDAERDYVLRSQIGGPIDPDNVDRAWKRHLTAAGLADRPFHSTRHTHASLLIAAGVHPKAIQARLGHASITTTLNTYGHLMPSAFEGIGARLDMLLRKPAEALAVVKKTETTSFPYPSAVRLP